MLPISIITLVMTFLTQRGLSSPVYNMQPAHITANIGTMGRNIRHLPCVSLRTGTQGICMFAIDCLKSNGTHLGTCIDRFYFGSCCHMPAGSPHPLDSVGGLLDNTIEETDNLSGDTDVKPMTKPTAANRPLDAIEPVVVDPSTTRKPPMNATKPATSTPQPTTRLPVNRTTPTTQASTAKLTSRIVTTTSTARPTTPHRIATTQIVETTTARKPIKVVITTRKPTPIVTTQRISTESKRPIQTTPGRKPTVTTSRPLPTKPPPRRTSTTTKKPSITNKPVHNKTTQAPPTRLKPGIGENETVKITTSRPNGTTDDPYKLTTFQTVDSDKIHNITIINVTTQRPKPNKPTSHNSTGPTQPKPRPSTTSKPPASRPKPTQKPARPAVTTQKKPPTPTPRPTKAPKPRPPSTTSTPPPSRNSTSKPTPTQRPPVKPTARPALKPTKPTNTTRAPAKPTRPTAKPGTTTTEVPVKFTTTTSVSPPERPAAASSKPPPPPKPQLVPVQILSGADRNKTVLTSTPTTTTTAATTITTTTRRTTTARRPTTQTVVTTTPPTTAAPTTTTTRTTTTAKTAEKVPVSMVPQTTPRPAPASQQENVSTNEVLSPEEQSSQPPGLVTWTNFLEQTTQLPPANITATDPDWTPITPPDGWVLLPSVSPADADVPTATVATKGPPAQPPPTVSATSATPAATTPPPTHTPVKFPGDTSASTMPPLAPTGDPTVASMFPASTSFKPPIAMFPDATSTSYRPPIDIPGLSPIPPPQTTAEDTPSTTPASAANTTSPRPAPDDDLFVTSPPVNMSDYLQVCGRRMFPQARIVGGVKSAFGRWPWQISLRQWRTSTYLHKCGAALLNENWAITAAHCVDNVPPSDLLLRLGEHDLSSESEPHGFQERRVQIVASHPQFDPRTFEYDLALLRFYEPVTFQPNIIPVCVPTNDEGYVGKTAHVTGWGRLYEDGPLPSILQEVSVPVINNTVCEQMYRSAGYIEHIPNIFICAGWRRGGFDSCEGDSGGPMVIQRPEDRRFILAGVISWGIGCAEPNQPGVYTRISEFRHWINQILQF